MTPAHPLIDLAHPWVALRHLWLGGVLAVVLARGPLPRRLRRHPTRHPVRRIAAWVAISGTAWAAPQLSHPLPTDPTPPTAVPHAGPEFDQ
jgi:hypothetical protein